MDFDLKYLLEVRGVLNAVEWIASLLVLIAAASSPLSINSGGWVYFTSLAGIVASFTLLLVFMARVADSMIQINWYLMRLTYDAIFAVFYFISMCISAAGAANAPAESSSTHSSNTFAAVFAAIAIIAFVWDGVETFKNKRQLNPPPSNDRLAPSGVTGELRYT